MVHAASGGGIVNKNLTDAMGLITELAESSREFDRRHVRYELSAIGSSHSHSLEEKVYSFTSLMRDMVMDKKVAKVCGICSSEGHVSEHCPQIQEDRVQNVNVAGYMEPSQRMWDPYSILYNPGWRDRPNFKWGNWQDKQFGALKQFIPRPQAQNPMPSHLPPQSGPNAPISIDNMIRALVTNQSNFQASVAQNELETNKSITNLENKMGLIATAVSKLEARDLGKLPSKTVTPKENISAILLRNGRQLVEAEKKKKKKPSKEMPVCEEKDIELEKMDDKLNEEPFSVFESEVPFPEALNRQERLGRTTTSTRHSTIVR
ncbi:hypothetical protein vseg_011750 [Gypsophila vaccaria]